MVVAGHRQHAAPARRSRRIGVFQDIHAAIDAGALAIPEGEDAIAGRAFEQIDLLRSPNRRGGEILVQARLEFDAMRFEPGFVLPQGLVETANRRAAIAGDKTRRIASGGKIALALQDWQLRQRLNTRQEFSRRRVALGGGRGRLPFRRIGGEKIGRDHASVSPGPRLVLCRADRSSLHGSGRFLRKARRRVSPAEGNLAPMVNRRPDAKPCGQNVRFDP